MGGDFNKATTYFSTFANVNNKNMAALGGNTANNNAILQRWKFSDKIEKVKAVEKYK